jgi:hypothetical protein
METNNEFVVNFLASFPKFTPRLFDKTSLVWTLDRIVCEGVVNETHLIIIPWGCLMNFVEGKQTRL